MGVTDQAEAERAASRREPQLFFEGTWLQRPLKTLNGIAPIDAAGHAVLRRQACGVVQFLADAPRAGRALTTSTACARKLGLTGGGTPATPGAAPTDVTALGAPELAALNIETLSDEQLKQALLTAQRLDAHEIGTRFARALVGRPLSGSDADRYPYFSYLVERALAAGQTDEALDTLNEGEKADCEQNEGRRRNDYELRRGKVHARCGEADARTTSLIA